MRDCKADLATSHRAPPLDELLAESGDLDFGSCVVRELILYDSGAHAIRGEYSRLWYIPLNGLEPPPSDVAARDEDEPRETATSETEHESKERQEAPPTESSEEPPQG